MPSAQQASELTAGLGISVVSEREGLAGKLSAFPSVEFPASVLPQHWEFESPEILRFKKNQAFSFSQEFPGDNVTIFKKELINCKRFQHRSEGKKHE